MSLRRRATIASIALALVAALAFTACAPLVGLFDQLRPQPAVPEVIGDDFGAQELEWRDCYDEMQCAVAAAPLDWDDPEGERIALALVKQPATDGDAQGTLFVNPGGPGASGVDHIAQGIDYAVGEPLQRAYDVIGWDPRGVGQSSAVVCLDDAGMDDHLYGPSDTDDLEPGTQEWVDAAIAENREFGNTCLDRTGPLLGHVDTGSTVQDLEMLRQIVGDPRLNYLGYSYGTYIGARYADAYPDKVGRMVLDGAIDPTTGEAEVVREQTRGFELALRAYMADCITRSDCPVSGSLDEAMGAWRAMIDQVDAAPLTGSDGRTVTSGTLITAIISPLYSQQNWPYLDQLYTTVTRGDADVALALADFYYDRIDGEYMSNLITAFGAVNCLDYPRPELDLDRMRAEAEELEQIAPTIGTYQGYSDVSCMGWPVEGVEDRPAVTAEGADPILVIGTTGDPATPLRWAESLASQLSSGVLLTYEGEGHTAYGQSPCVNEIVESYFLTGEVPPDGARCA